MVSVARHPKNPVGTRMLVLPTTRQPHGRCAKGCVRRHWGPSLAQWWEPLTTQSLGVAWLEVVDDHACDVVYVPQFQHVLPILVPLLYLQGLGACGAGGGWLQLGRLPRPLSYRSQHTGASRAHTHIGGASGMCPMSHSRLGDPLPTPGLPPLHSGSL